MFLKRGSMTLGAAAALAAIPGLPLLETSVEADAPAVGTISGDVAPLTEPLLAHVKDLQTGEISLYMGEKEIIYNSPRLAALLRQAAH